MKRILTWLHREEGHAEPYIGVFPAAIGLVMLGIGAAGDTGWLAIAGGIVAAVGVIAAFAANHATVEKGMYGRLDKLDGNK